MILSIANAFLSRIDD